MFLMKNPLQRTIRTIGSKLLTENRWVRFREGMRFRLMVKPEMEPETRSYLQGAFRADILRLQRLISRDLSSWL